MKNSTQPAYVTEATFKKEANWTRKEFKTVHEKIDGVALSLAKTQADVARIEKTMMTMKEDGQRLAHAIVKNQSNIERAERNMMTNDTGDQILSQLQDLAKKYENAEVSARIHLNQVMDFRPRIEDHEQRLVALEKRPPTIQRK